MVDKGNWFKLRNRKKNIDSEIFSDNLDFYAPFRYKLRTR